MLSVNSKSKNLRFQFQCLNAMNLLKANSAKEIDNSAKQFLSCRGCDLDSIGSQLLQQQIKSVKLINNLFMFESRLQQTMPKS